MDDPLACAHGTPWLDHFVGPLFTCPGCAQAQREAIARFAEMVQAGVYDEAGYTPAERRAQRRQRGALCDEAVETV